MSSRFRPSVHFFGLTIILSIVLAACNFATPAATGQNPAATSPLPASSPTQPATPPHIPTSTASALPTATSTASPTNTVPPAFTATPSPTLTETPTITPTYTTLRGTVLEQANCRYGPGAAYLYKYGLYPGNNIEIIGRNDPGTWIVIQAIGGSNPCWVKAALLGIHGNVMTTAPTVLSLPTSPYYGPLTGVHAERKGDEVTISWNSLVLRAGDDSLQYPYLIEAWLCKDGALAFTATGAWETITTLYDEPGCSEPSHGRIYGVEKHGYTRWVTIPWPDAPAPTSTP